TAGAGGVPLRLAPGLSAAMAVRVKQADCSEGGAAGAGGVPLSSTNCPLLVLAQYFYFWYRATVVQIIQGY
ncbi:hypothetical protein, partial [Sansalvadorimonas verongulae]|uniref:hypothetical protein n=1 Tax=Sansalvadorimonas verongulae TaxID=2172824 RepID=UPI0018AD1726